MLCDFINSLFQGRAILVSSPKQAEPSDVDETLKQIQVFEKDWQLELPGEPISFVADSALWSAKSLYLACSLVTYRDSDALQINQLLSNSPPDRSLAESHYSVDLTMRFLPDLIRLAKSASTDDPLLDSLFDWARMWPLSSVGIKNIGDVDATPLRTSTTLMRLYVDRIIATGDTERLNDPVVSQLATTILGHYPELEPAVANTLKKAQDESELRNQE